MNGTSPSLVTRFSECSPEDISMSSVVVGELLFGAHNSARVAENLRKVQRFLQPFISFPFDDECAARYADVRLHLKRRGEMIGSNDLQIAATALAHDLTLVTHNTREFGRVPALQFEDWQVSA